jgi:hypothetical protein
LLSSVVVVFVGATAQEEEVVLPFHSILQPKIHERESSISAKILFMHDKGSRTLKDMYERV